MLTRPTPASPLRRHAATPTIAQSWARRLNFWKLHPAPCIFGHPDLRQELLRAEGRGEEALVEVGGGDLPRPVRALGDVRRAEGERRGGQVGRRIGVGDRAADRAAVAHLRIADLAGRVGEQRDVLGQHVGALDVHVPRQRPDGDVVAGVTDVGQVAQPADVDQHGRLGQPQPHQRQQAVPAGEELGLVAVLADEAGSPPRRSRPGRSRTWRGS